MAHYHLWLKKYVYKLQSPKRGCHSHGFTTQRNSGKRRRINNIYHVIYLLSFCSRLQIRSPLLLLEAVLWTMYIHRTITFTVSQCPRLPASHKSFTLGRFIIVSNALDEAKGYSEFRKGGVRKLWVWDTAKLPRFRTSCL